MLTAITGMARSKIHLILDFDGTIIKNNTLPFLDYLKQKDSPTNYDSFLEPYMREYTQHVRDYEPVQSRRVTLQQEYDFLESLLKIERNSIERIESSGWLKGLKWSPTDVSAFDIAAAHIGRRESLTWRAGFANLVQQTWKAEGIVDIVSVNWSSNFIRALLRRQFGTAINVSRIRVFSNEIDPSGSGHLSRIRWGNEDQITNEWLTEKVQNSNANVGIWTAKDKAKAMRSIIKAAQTSDMTTVYIGDSKTDLRCIMEADIGICAREDADLSSEQISLKEALDRLEIRQFPVRELHSRLLESVSAPESPDQHVYYAQDFDIIREVLFSLPESTQCSPNDGLSAR